MATSAKGDVGVYLGGPNAAQFRACVESVKLPEATTIAQTPATIATIKDKRGLDRHGKQLPRRQFTAATAIPPTPPRGDDDEPLDTRSLDVAIRETAPRWRGTRNEKSAIGQAELTIKDLKAYHAAGLRGKQIAEAPAMRVCDVSTKVLRAMVTKWRAAGLSPASCHMRLSVLSVMGIDVNGSRPPLGKALKWWLTPDMQADLTARLRAGTLGCDDDEGDGGEGLRAMTPPMMAREKTPPITLQVGSFTFQQTTEAPPVKERIDAPTDLILANFIDWTVWTGLRVGSPSPSPLLIRERLPQRHRARPKDPRQSATLPISSDATALAKRIFAGSSGDALMFPVCYRQLSRRWRVVMKTMGVATLWPP